PDTAIEQVERKDPLTVGGQVAETALHEGDGIGLDQLLHDVTMMKGDRDRAERGDERHNGDRQLEPAWQSPVRCVRRVNFRILHCALRYACILRSVCCSRTLPAPGGSVQPARLVGAPHFAVDGAYAMGMR